MYKKLKGTTDFYPQEQFYSDRLNKVFSDMATKYGFEHVEPPMLESMKLLTAKSGEEIKEQIFVTEKRSKEEIGLRFEFTASLARMFIEKQKALLKPVRWFCFNRVWRYERPQAGREREFFQFNVEIYGSENGESDAEIINLAIDTLRTLGLKKKDFFVRLNNRKLLQGLLLEIVTDDNLEKVTRAIDKKEKISEEDFEKELNFLDKEQIKKIKEVLELNFDDLENYDMNSLAREGYNKLKSVMQFIKKEYVKFDMRIVRGLDYYTGTVFEIFDTDKKFRALCGGGRYDNVIDVFGGQPTPATGFGMGYSTVKLLLEDKKLLPNYDKQIDYFVACVDDKVKPKVVKIANKLRKKNSVLFDVMGRSFSKQMKFANQLGAKKLVVVGPEELEKNIVKIKDMKTGKETTKKINEI